MGMTGRSRAKISYDGLEARREALVQRLAHLHPALAKSAGHKTVRVLLGSKYRSASLSARLKILQAAHFLMSVLEMTPPS
jgi:hypothetical protein